MATKTSSPGTIARRTSGLTWLKDRPLLTSGLLFFASATLVNLGNYLFNMILGRWLGPAAFADLSLIVTLMLVSTFLATTFSTVTARFTASFTANGDVARLAALHRWLYRVALGLGGILLLGLVGGAPFLADFFQMQSPWPFVILGLGMPIFMLQAVDRGMLQGQARFGRLALSGQAEMWVRLLGAIAFVAVGWSVNGAVGALLLSFVATWLVVVNTGRTFERIRTPLSRVDRHKIIRYCGPVILGLIGQIVINNSDILIVKRFFSPSEAGQYAALAMIGRVVFFATWSIVTMMFPLVAQRHERGEPHRILLGIALGIVAGISGLILLATLLVPELIVTILFGSAYLFIAPLLAWYALATTLYTLANVIINYHLSLGNGRGSMLVLVAGLAQVGGLWVFHSSLLEVVMVQLYIMIGLLGALGLWDYRLARRTKKKFSN